MGPGIDLRDFKWTRSTVYTSHSVILQPWKYLSVAIKEDAHKDVADVYWLSRDTGASRVTVPGYGRGGVQGNTDDNRNISWGRWHERKGARVKGERVKEDPSKLMKHLIDTQSAQGRDDEGIRVQNVQIALFEVTRLGDGEHKTPWQRARVQKAKPVLGGE